MGEHEKNTMLGSTPDQTHPEPEPRHQSTPYLSTPTALPNSSLAHTHTHNLIRNLSKPAYLLRNTIYHARLLPRDARHAFRHETLSVLVGVRALEGGELDVEVGMCGLAVSVFGYGASGVRAGRLVGIRSDPYLFATAFNIGNKINPVYDPTPAPIPSLLHKLESVVGAAVRDAWMVTTPSCAGFEGINPLTVWVVYLAREEAGHGGLQDELDTNGTKSNEGEKGTKADVVVLEVHNTFGENHVYVLETRDAHSRGVGEAHEYHAPVDKGGGREEEEWIVPRTFHVSPFNDREGSYRVRMRLPSWAPWNEPQGEGEGGPLPDIWVDLHEPLEQRMEGKRAGPQKLATHVRPTSSLPLHGGSALLLLRAPLWQMFVAFPRIAREAWVLHYRKGLGVRIRPEPRGWWVPRGGGSGTCPSGGTEGGATPNGDEGVMEGGNTCPGRGGEVGGTVRYLPEGPIEAYARRLHERFLQRRVGEINERVGGKKVRVVLVPGNVTHPRRVFEGNGEVSEAPNGPHWDSPSIDDKTSTLTIQYTTSRFFLLLFRAPDIDSALKSVAEGMNGNGDPEGVISDLKLFRSVYCPRRPSPEGGKGSVEVADVTQRVRAWFLGVPLSLNAGSSLEDMKLDDWDTNKPDRISPTHFLAPFPSPSSNEWVVTAVICALWAWTGSMVWARRATGGKPTGEKENDIKKRKHGASDEEDGELVVHTHPILPLLVLLVGEALERRVFGLFGVRVVGLGVT